MGYKTYVVEAVGTGRLKIGKATSIKTRLKQIQAHCPVIARVIATADEDIERILHKTLEVHRLHGEWFIDNEVVRKEILTRMTPTNIVVTVGRHNAIGRKW